MQNFLPPWLTLGVILIAIFPFVGGIMVVCAEFVVGRQRKKARLKRYLILAGGLLSIVGAFLGAISQSRDSYDLMAMTTGGNGYSYFSYILPIQTGLRFLIINNSDYPLYDVTANVLDQNKWQRFISNENRDQPSDVGTTLEIYNEDMVPIAVGNLRPSESRWVWDAPVPTETLQRYIISISSRNNYVEQEMLLARRADGTYTSVFRVWRQTGEVKDGWHLSEIVKELVSDDFRKLYPSGVPWSIDLSKPQQGRAVTSKN